MDTQNMGKPWAKLTVPSRGSMIQRQAGLKGSLSQAKAGMSVFPGSGAAALIPPLPSPPPETRGPGSLAEHRQDNFLALEIGLGNRVDGPFHGNLMGLVVILAHHRALRPGRLAPDLAILSGMA